MGQYKVDRDLPLLASIATNADSAWSLSVTGRGWPDIQGWDVESRFVSEEEFDTGLRAAGVILVPYRRFYQSGVAIRALEVGTPVVGPRQSVLSSVVGPKSPWLADDDVKSWTEAIRSSLSSSAEDIAMTRKAYTDAAIAGWSAFTREAN